VCFLLTLTINFFLTDSIFVVNKSLRKKGTKVVTGSVPFQKGKLLSILGAIMYILGANMYH